MPRRGWLALVLLGALAASYGAKISAPDAQAANTSPIRHVIFLYQENHSFDNIFGPYCVLKKPAGHCDGRMGYIKLSNGQTVPLHRAPDRVDDVCHSIECQGQAVNGGNMDGWWQMNGCYESQGYKCMDQFWPDQIPIEIELANKGALLDRFYTEPNPSSGAHLFPFTGEDNLGLTGGIPLVVPKGYTAGPGWGCDSNKQGDWIDPKTGAMSSQFFCNPNAKNLPYGGAAGPTKVKPAPDFFTSILDPHHISWTAYGAAKTAENYKWNLLPYQAAALNRDQSKTAPTKQVIADAKNGTLPQVSFVTPTGSLLDGSDTSQHNGASMRVGDNFIGDVIDAVRSGPDRLTTAVIITWDDCGCFYDHVAPPAGQGIRAPLLIWSPWVKKGHVDHQPARFASVLAFIEKTFGLPSLTSLNPSARDGQVPNDLTSNFNFNLSPQQAIANLNDLNLRRSPVTAAELADIRAHAHEDHGDDT